ncbi:Peptidase M75, Imelysin [Bacteroides helcogenes P 36-108]|uniref:Peptidase M75, Imelysin n=2 Tax=Bacteroides helcogenes TaxID=290053 RepID=E6SUK8_BACT6|nr:Peptidase M75, Imelysin [Bacteroides helcogenes P 36-108]
MKKNFLKVVGCMFAFVVGMASCSDDKGTDNSGSAPEEAFSCIEQILDGCMDIANEVGETKIGEPVSKWATDQTAALYSVESWYSWHSREDYSNNIYSIRNAYYGTLDGTVGTNSLANLIAKNNASLDTQVRNAISDAVDAILAIKSPFRNNINSTEARTAMTACADLNDVLKDLKGYIERTAAVNTNAVLDPIIVSYVDVVVLPTYNSLKEKNAALYTAAQKFNSTPSNANFEAVCEAWLEARQPWETSEAFLFGPVDALGLDPNMDSWPLDQSAIVNILNSGNYDDLNWSDGDNNDKVEAAQSVRGFHTLEFLAFRNGVARTLTDVADSSNSADLVYTSANAASWGNYMVQVAYLLKSDAETLYNSWSVSYEGGESYAAKFKKHVVQ